MFTYGYIREATMAHLDLDEIEAQDMNLLSRFHIYANEAMQAVCASKPMYQYIDITVVEKFAPLVMDGAFFRPATKAEINWDVELQGPRPFNFASEAQTKNYYHEKDIYEVLETVSMLDTFINFANKQAYKITELKPTDAQVLEAEAFGTNLKLPLIKSIVKVDDDLSYVSRNKIKFYKPGRYMIPAKFMWYRFDSGIGDEVEIEMPSDILMTIPLYIASICLQIDNIQKAQILRQEFELALARCTSSDFMTLNSFESLL
jgi:hypothetical protein